jgi:copper chaperone CopZ
MYKTTVKIVGMACSMCESHVNDAFRSKLNVKKVTSSHKKGESVIISDTEITSEQLEKALDGSGYRILGSECVPYEKKGLFSKR